MVHTIYNFWRFFKGNEMQQPARIPFDGGMGTDFWKIYGKKPLMMVETFSAASLPGTKIHGFRTGPYFGITRERWNQSRLLTARK
jgi:hypothetical protein